VKLLTVVAKLDFIFAVNAFFLTLCNFCSLFVKYLKNKVTLEPVLHFTQVCVFREFVLHSVNSWQQKLTQFYANIFLFPDVQRITSSVLLILRACLYNVGISFHMKCSNILWLRWLSLRQTCHLMYTILLGWLLSLISVGSWQYTHAAMLKCMKVEIGFLFLALNVHNKAKLKSCAINDKL
jgi:hypothetical protein